MMKWERVVKRVCTPEVDIESVFVFAGYGWPYERCTRWSTLVYDVCWWYSLSGHE